MTARPGLARRALLVGTGLLALVVPLAACTTSSTGDVGTGRRDAIALLLPESKAARYGEIDQPEFEDVVERRCPTCRVLSANAGQDAALQQQQAESALTQGAGVLVLDAVDAVAAKGIVARAHARGVPVIAYDRFIADADLDYLVSFDSRRVGRIQGVALARAIAERAGRDTDETSSAPGGGVLLVTGAATDPNSRGLAEGARTALEAAGLTVLAQYDTPDWSPDKAQEWVTARLSQLDDDVDGVYAANDGIAGGAISALRAAGRVPVVPVTGQDAELAAIQRILAGEQEMTVYKALSVQARTAGELAVRVLHGEEPVTTARVEGVPAMLIDPVAVTRGDVRRIIVDGGVYTTEEICVQPYVRACEEAGLLDEAGA
ncbi:substrate-binding domain-containing protein [Cellulomonas sp. DKR-3]|uniref:Substrate-binding domain-containing protein n=1 Tax=Cellulomonas fulva TaxID=2835530 RepID=A0ABS5TZ72_9CELL|nr:substrate-binding domain-containing protein [Cellulomonas fulva]MBT0994434.1 substrate-binding domain-containing protein [Cellulomonas fulva]